jgi:hypothetical protein
MQLNLLTELCSQLTDDSNPPPDTQISDPTNPATHVTPPRRRSRSNSVASSCKLNHQQIQVCLIEISHLVASLSEAAAAVQLVPLLVTFLGHKEHGVRFEAATAVAAVAHAFPEKSFQVLDECFSRMRR